MLSYRAAHEALHYPAKTPSRAVRGKSENVGIARTVGPKGKGNDLRTPFGAGTHGVKGGFATTGKPRPFLDKTPFPNRVQQQGSGNNGKGDGLGKVPKLILLETEATHTPDSLRPSSTRKHPRLPRSAGKNFETPVNQGNHWDAGDTSLGSPEVQAQEASLERDDLDEIEYMAPNTLDLAYQPPFDFDLPNYRDVAQDFRKLVFSIPLDDFKPQLPDLGELQPVSESWEFIPLKELEDDDPFRQLETLSKAIEATRRPTLQKVRRPAPSMSSTKVVRPSTNKPTVSTVAGMRPSSAAARPKASAVSGARMKSMATSNSTPAMSRTSSRPGLPKSNARITKTTATAQTNQDALVFAESKLEEHEFLFDV